MTTTTTTTSRDQDRVRTERDADIVRAIAELDDTSEVDQAALALEEAVDAFVATCAAYNRRYEEIGTQLIQLAELPAGVRFHPGVSIEISGHTVRPAHAPNAISRAARTALKTYFPRMRYDLNQG